MASLFIKDPKTNALAERLAAQRGLTKTAAVTLALTNELDRHVPPADIDRRAARDRMLEFWRKHPLPKDLGPAPDKAFYDTLWGEPD